MNYEYSIAILALLVLIGKSEYTDLASSEISLLSEHEREREREKIQRWRRRCGGKLMKIDWTCAPNRWSCCYDSSFLHWPQGHIIMMDRVHVQEVTVFTRPSLSSQWHWLTTTSRNLFSIPSILQSPTQHLRLMERHYASMGAWVKHLFSFRLTAWLGCCLVISLTSQWDFFLCYICNVWDGF